jgi:hypothetical protein
MSEQRIEPERYELSEAPRYRSALTRRQFVGAVGAGVVVLVVARDGLSLEAQEPGEAEALGASADPISASLHIGEDGAVTVFTGKVEVGQDIRTSLTQAVAEELGVPPRAHHADHGRHGPRAVRRGDVRQPLDAADGHAAPARRRGRACGHGPARLPAAQPAG